MTTIGNRLMTALAAPAIAAGILLGGFAPGIAAPAQAGTATQTCVTTGNRVVTPNSVNPLTRVAQVNAIQAPSAIYAPPSSCIGH